MFWRSTHKMIRTQAAQKGAAAVAADGTGGKRVLCVWREGKGGRAEAEPEQLQ